MSFLYPAFLGALAAISIPIIIHLFYFRRFKKVQFSQVKWLKEIKKETASRSRLKHLLVLLARIAAIAALVFAFAQPFLPKKETAVVQGTRAVSIFVDNSFSMNATGADVPLLDQAKAKATQIAEAYSNEDDFQLITNDLEARHQRLVPKEAFEGYIDEIQSSPQVHSLGKIIERQKQALESSSAKQKNIFIISDFQKNISEFQNDTAYQFYLLPLQATAQANVFIDSLWFDTPVQTVGQNATLLLRINNSGQNDVENSRLSLSINNETKALKDFSLKANAQLVDTLRFVITDAGWNRGKVNLSDYPINFDDDYFFAFNIAAEMKVLAINAEQESKYLNALFAKEATISLSNQLATKLDYATLNDYRVIILNNLSQVSSGLAAELSQYLANGGSVVIFIPENANTQSYNEWLGAMQVNRLAQLNRNPRAVSNINTQQEIFNDVFEKVSENLDLPQANVSWDMTSYANTNEQILLKYKDGGAMLGKYQVGDGKLYLVNVGLNNTASNLPTHAIFVPMMIKTVLVSGVSPTLAYTVGKDQFIEMPAPSVKTENIIHLKSDSEDFIPGQQLRGKTLLLALNNQLKNAGTYFSYETAEQPLAYFGFNYNRRESVLDYYNADALKNMFAAPNVHIIDAQRADIAQTVGDIDKGVALWKICLLLALAFFLIESLLLRFMPE